MLVLRVPPQISTQRMNTCLACKYFKSSTKSCGTLFIGDRLSIEESARIQEENQIVYRKKRIRLCGCRMQLKTKLAFAQCPIGKWKPYYLNSDEMNELRSFMESLPKSGRIVSEDVDRLYDWVYRITRIKLRRCTTCVSQLIQEINSNLKSNEINIDATEGNQNESEQSASNKGSQISETGEVDQRVSRDAPDSTDSSE